MLLELEDDDKQTKWFPKVHQSLYTLQKEKSNSSKSWSENHKLDGRMPSLQVKEAHKTLSISISKELKDASIQSCRMDPYHQTHYIPIFKELKDSQIQSYGI